MMIKNRATSTEEKPYYEASTDTSFQSMSTKPLVKYSNLRDDFQPSRCILQTKTLTLSACTQRCIHIASYYHYGECNLYPQKDHQGDWTNRAYKNAHIQFLVRKLWLRVSTQLNVWVQSWPKPSRVTKELPVSKA